MVFLSAVSIFVNRYLKHVGYDVTYVRNFTDIDDKVAYARSF